MPPMSGSESVTAQAEVAVRILWIYSPIPHFGSEPPPKVNCTSLAGETETDQPNHSQDTAHALRMTTRPRHRYILDVPAALRCLEWEVEAVKITSAPHQPTFKPAVRRHLSTVVCEATQGVNNVTTRGVLACVVRASRKTALTSRTQVPPQSILSGLTCVFLRIWYSTWRSGTAAMYRPWHSWPHQPHLDAQHCRPLTSWNHLGSCGPSCIKCRAFGRSLETHTPVLIHITLVSRSPQPTPCSTSSRPSAIADTLI